MVLWKTYLVKAYKVINLSPSCFLGAPTLLPTPILFFHVLKNPEKSPKVCGLSVFPQSPLLAGSYQPMEKAWGGGRS